MLAASRRIGEFLVDRKVLSRDHLEQLLERESEEGVSLSKLLVAEKLVGEKDLVAAVADQAGMRFVDFDHLAVNPALEGLVPVELARRRLAVAVDLEGDNLVVAMADPSDAEAVAELEKGTGWPLTPAIAVKSELRRMVTLMYGEEAGAVAGGAETAQPAPDGATLAGAPPTELHVNDLLERVVDLGGSSSR
jgi:type IV pilus assembly protein PilB